MRIVNKVSAGNVKPVNLKALSLKAGSANQKSKKNRMLKEKNFNEYIKAMMKKNGNIVNGKAI